MADRFPSIEDLDEGVEPHTGGGGDFLERERAALGDDAAMFSSNDRRGVSMEDADDDLLGDGDYEPAQHMGGSLQADDLGDFESSFPQIDNRNDAVGPGGSITNTSGPGGYTNYKPQFYDEDTEPIKQWREQRSAELARRDEASQRKKEETVETARKDIDSFYDNYNRKIDKQKTTVAKEAEDFMKTREDTTAGGTSWERISKLVDLSGKGQVGGGADSTKKRMREMLVSLKGDKDAPGASGI